MKILNKIQIPFLIVILLLLVHILLIVNHLNYFRHMFVWEVFLWFDTLKFYIMEILHKLIFWTDYTLDICLQGMSFCQHLSFAQVRILSKIRFYAKPNLSKIKFYNLSKIWICAKPNLFESVPKQQRREKDLESHIEIVKKKSNYNSCNQQFWELRGV